jgi:superfamily II DNA or RNA helicase
MRAADAIAYVTSWSTEVMAGSMKGAERDNIMNRFQSGETRVLCSVDMITTGFDFPALDCIVCLRPTLSSSLWVQIQGRGTRLHDSKKNCLVLDFVGNLQRLGGVDMYEKFYRERPDAEVEELPAVPTKPYVKKERKVYPGVRTLIPIDPMTGLEVTENSVITAKVSNVNCVAVFTRRNPNQPVLLVQYACVTDEGARIDASTFISTETPTSQSVEFFKRRFLAVNLPSPARSLTWQLKGARQPVAVTVRKSGRYWNVLEEYFNGETE